MLKIKTNSQENTFQIPAEDTSRNHKTPQLFPEQEDNFQAEIVNRPQKTIPLANMTKSQIIKSCESLFEKTNDGKSQKDLFIGNCVVSNYQELYQKISTDNQVLIKQLQTQQIAAKKYCENQSKHQRSKLLPPERALVVGICISNRTNR